MFAGKNIKFRQKTIVTLVVLAMVLSFAALASADELQAPTWAPDAALTVSDITGSAFKISWPSATGADSYEVLVSNTTGGVTNDALNTTVSGDTSCEVTGLTAGRRYDIEVTAANTAGDSAVSLESMVVTTPAKPLFTFKPGIIADSAIQGRYLFQPVAIQGVTTDYEQVYTYDKAVKPGDTRFLWYLQAGFNGTNARDHVDSFRLFNLTDGEEIALDYGTTNFGNGTGSWTPSGVTESDTGYTLTHLMASGDFKVAKIQSGSTWIRFELDIARYLEAEKDYAITIDPQFHTGGQNPNVLGKVYRYEFSTRIVDTQAPAWENDAQITLGEITADSIALSWPAATDDYAVAKYKIAVSKDGNPVGNLETTNTSYIVTGLSAKTQYSFTVTAVDAARNESNPLAAVTATTLPGIPAWPDNAVLEADGVMATELNLRWPQIGGGDLAGYKVYVDGVEEASLPAMQTYYELYGLNSGQKYILSVQPFNELGQAGAAIETMVVTPGAGGLTFTFSPTAVDQGKAGYYHHYGIINPVDLDHFSLAWNFDKGLDKNLRFNLECIHLFDQTTGQELTLDLGTEPYVSTPEGVFYAGDFKYISTGGGDGSGDPTGKVRMLKFEPGAATLAQLTKGAPYVIEIDPGFTSNNGEAKLGKIFTFAFTTAVDDTEAPVWPAGAQMTAGKVGTDAFVLSWPDAGDNIGIVEYRLYRQGEALELIQAFDSRTNSYKMEGLTPATTYNLVLRARDAKSNYTPDLTISVTTLLTDDQAPNWPQGSKLTADNVLFDNMDLSWTAAADNVAVTGYRLLKNGSVEADLDADTDTYHVAQLTPGTAYVFKVEARDKAGNYSTTGPKLAVSTLDGEADTTPPYWTGNGSGWTTSTNYDYDKTRVTYSWPWAADNVAVTAYLVYRNGVQLAKVDAYTNSYADVLDLDNNTYTYSVYAVDASGNRSVEGKPMAVTSRSPDQDTYSPVWPAGTGITLSEFTDDSAVKIKWTPAQDNNEVRGYVVIKDGLWVEWADRGEPDTATRSFTDCFVVYNPYINNNHMPSPNYPALVSGETYTFSVKAFDLSENSSKGDPKITFVMGTNPTAGAGIPFALINVENKRGSLNSITGALNQVLAPQDPENIQFVWEFDELLAAGWADKITLTNTGTGEEVILAAANFQYSENRGKGILTLDLAQTGSKLADQAHYVVKLDKTLAAQSGKQLGFDLAWQFTTDFADKQAPQWGAGDSLTIDFLKAPTIATLTWPSADDNVAVTQYQVYQGETLLATLPAGTLTYDVEGLACNTAYNFKVSAGDYLNNFSMPLTKPAITPAADTTAPNWQDGAYLTFSDIAADHVTVSWPVADDNYQVKRYQIYQDGINEPLAEVTDNVLNYTVTGLAGETSYNITVRALDFSENSRDLAGNVTTIVDRVNPVWPAGSKLQARDIKDTAVTLYWDAATDNVGVTKYHIYRNGEKVLTVDSAVTEATVDGLSGATEYTFTLEAEDLQGNKTTTLLSLTQWTAPNSVTLGAAFPFNLDKPLSHNVSVDLAGNTINNVVDGSFTKNNVAFTFSFSKTLTDGTWLNNIELRDNDGKPVELAPDDFTYLETAGATSKIIITVPSGLVASGQYTLTVKQDLQAADTTLLGRNFIWAFNVSVGMYGVTDIAAGYNSYSAFKYPSDRFYLVLKDDGSVWTWGNNDYGTLGDGTYDRRDIPVRVEGLTGITALEAGRDSCFALDQDGAVWAWGSNEYGQLGKGTVPSGTSGRYGNNIPEKIDNLPAITKLSYGFGNVAALDVNGEVWCWGSASQAGLSSKSQCSGTPLKVSDLVDVVDVAAGFHAFLAVTGNGDVFIWGSGSKPAQVAGLSEIVAVDAQGIDQKNTIWMALKADGTAYIWDKNSSGSVSVVPVQVAGASQVKAVIADGPYVLNASGQVSNVDYKAPPALGANISALNNVVKLASSAQGGLALQTDGALLQFIGAAVTPVDLTMAPADVPVWPADSKLTITNLAGAALTLNWAKPDVNVSGFAIMQDGNRIATVSGDALSYDVLGLTNGQSYTFKVEARFINSDWTSTGPAVTQTMNEWNPSMQGAGKLAMSGRHTLMVGDDGNVWAWGQNEYGQLGIGNNNEQLSPVKIDGLVNVVAVAAGDNHSLALDREGNVWAWGKNNLYQLGNGSTTGSNVPVKVITGGIKAISAAADHNIALKNDGKVLGWGADGP
ncbi:MAG: fibronectin type III domain-containing protein, partial [Desulfotomaculaceae bacterium]|nr:fibronectin type III domain-containing protein [Desulfotomaculaceae bacterium]